MYAEVKIQCPAACIRVDVLDAGDIFSERVSAPVMKTAASAAAKMLASSLCLCALSCTDIKQAMSCTAEIIFPVDVRQLHSNFITVDNMYILTDDGSLFYVMEE